MSSHKETILLIPGALGTPRFWQHQIDALGPYFNIQHADITGLDSIEAMADRVINSHDGKCHIVGFSLGGYVALELASRFPDRVNSLVLINSGANPLSEKGRADREKVLKLIDQGQFDRLLNSLFKKSVYAENQKNDIEGLLKLMAIEVGVKNYSQQLKAILNKPNHESVLKNMHQKVMIINSDNDAVMPPDRSKYLADHLPDATLYTLKNCGHVAPLEQPESVTEKIKEFYAA